MIFESNNTCVVVLIVTITGNTRWPSVIFHVATKQRHNVFWDKQQCLPIIIGGNQAIDFLDKIVFGERNKHQTAVSLVVAKQTGNQEISTRRGILKTPLSIIQSKTAMLPQAERTGECLRLKNAYLAGY